VTAGLPIMPSCPARGCRLENDVGVRIALVMTRPSRARPASEAAIALDRLTHEGLTTGNGAKPVPPFVYEAATR
jgi:hypothetical protein